jgi:hypothetical protein
MTYPPPAGVNFQRLRPFLQDALRQQKDKRTALAIAQRLDRDEWRAIAQPGSTDGGFGMRMVGLEGGIGGVLTVPAASGGASERSWPGQKLTSKGR